MASAQVSRKQEHLEAGKRKLEEFRRKKAVEKAKKTTTNQVLGTDGVQNVRKPSESEHLHRTDSNDIGTSNVLVEDREGGTPVPDVANKESDISLKGDYSSANSYTKPPLSANHIDTNSSVREHSYLKSAEYEGDGASVALDRFRSTKDDNESSTQLSSRIGNYHFLNDNLSSGENHSSSHPSFLELDTYPSNNSYGPEKDHSHGKAGESTVFSGGLLPQNSVSNLQPFKMGNSGQGDSRLTSSTYLDMGDKKFTGDIDHTLNMNHLSPWTSDNRYADYDSDARSSSNRAPPSPPASGRRSRPSFLDSINIPKGPSSSPSLFEAAKNDSSSKVYPMDGLGLSASHRSANSSVASGDGVDLFNHAMENKNNLFSQKQNEDFAALEQHIEDLTQEKFSLQRALEASRALVESLASENSALTDSFNQQGAVVNQLKFDLEQLQEEINARLVELEAIKHEYANALMECNAADERAKLLASEVIGLEEKALHLRSNELKLERQLENAESEISSYRKKISSLERDRQDLQSTINAFQEEKKLLQTKLRKTSSSGKSIDNKTPCAKQDVSTSTDDLDINATAESANSENFGNALPREGAPSSQFAHESVDFGLDGQPMSIPSDQIRMIQNIYTLLAELALEKDQLVQALSEESSQSSRLSELNKELTRKLEAQTQRLELLTAKSMASDSIQLIQQQDYRTMQETVTYADEGDEVVERVLGWIMKLFPGGSSSRRRSSKHL